MVLEMVADLLELRGRGGGKGGCTDEGKGGRKGTGKVQPSAALCEFADAILRKALQDVDRFDDASGLLHHTFRCVMSSKWEYRSLDFEVSPAHLIPNP